MPGGLRRWTRDQSGRVDATRREPQGGGAAPGVSQPLPGGFGLPRSDRPLSAGERRRWLDDRLRDWSDADLEAIVALLGRYNAALD